MRAVVDPNVHISALLATRGAPAGVLRAWIDGAFDLIVSPLLLAQLERAFACPKLRKRIPAEEAARVVGWLRESATIVDDPAPIRSLDPGDDYLLALGVTARAALVTGDGHLLTLDTELPIYPPTAFLATITA